MSTSVPVAKLADIADLNPSLAASLSASEEVAFMPMSAVDAESASAVDRETRPYSQVNKGYTPFLDGDVLVAKITPCFENGKIAHARLTRRYGFGSTEFHVVRPRTGRSDARYLVHFLRQDRIRRQGESRMTGSAGQRRVPENFLAALSVPVPPLPEQRRIAAILDKADALRAKRRTALAQLDTLTQSIFLDMFGDPVASGRSWPIKSIEAVAASDKYSIVDGPFGSSIKPEDYRTTGVPVVRITNITRDGYFSQENLLFIARHKFDTLKRSSVAGDDVLVSRVGTLGNTCIFPHGIGDALLSTTGVCKITLDQHGMLPVFLHAAIRLPSFQLQIHRSASTSVQKYFNLTALRSWKIIVPPIELQHEFARRVALVEDMKATHRTSLTEMGALFASLQHRAFLGDL